MGEAMAPASGRETSGGSIPDAGAALVRLLLIAALLISSAACGDDAPARPAPDPRAPPAHETAAFASTPPALAPEAGRYWHAYLADVLGDDGGGRAGYEAAYASAGDDPALAARAALHLAAREATAGNRRRALELVARATQLAPDDDGVRDAADRLQAGLAAAPSGAEQDEVRGPPLGTPLPGATPEVAADFAAAEKLLARAHRIRMEPALESLSSTVRVKEGATDAAVLAYKKVAEAGGLPAVAAEFRAGSLYHDLAVELVFDLPPELDPAVASRLRRTLGDSARAYLRKAVQAYKRALAIDAHGDDAELWRVPAQTNLRAAGELLGEGEK
jgi:tetratricopeptide (TPR) repeat protein